jgi:hypothetical protein
MKIKTEFIRKNALNSNIMTEGVKAKLRQNIVEQGGRYPQLILRKISEPPTEFDIQNTLGEPTGYRLIDGHNRFDVLKELGNEEVNADVWEIDDKTELLLLATLNELKGTQDLTRRAKLLETINSLGVSKEKLLKLIPEDNRRLDFVLSIVQQKDLVDINDRIESEREAMRERFIADGIDPDRAAAMADIYAFKKYVPKEERVDEGTKYGLRKVLIFWFDSDEDFDFAAKYFGGENEKEPNTKLLMELIK